MGKINKNQAHFLSGIACLVALYSNLRSEGRGFYKKFSKSIDIKGAKW
jgi:hypothetical protein